MMLVHGGVRTHSVEQLEFLQQRNELQLNGAKTDAAHPAVFLDDVPSALVMSGEQTADHHKVSSCKAGYAAHSNFYSTS